MVLLVEVVFQVVGVIRDPFKIREQFEEWDFTGAARSHLLRLMEYKNIYIPREAMGASEVMLGAVVKVALEELLSADPPMLDALGLLLMSANPRARTRTRRRGWLH